MLISILAMVGERQKRLVADRAFCGQRVDF